MGLSGVVTETHYYDGDGVRVRSVITTTGGVTTTLIVGSHYEIVAGQVRKYYAFGGVRIGENSNATLYYLLTDHLGSTAKVTQRDGTPVHETRYHPWGGQRYTSGALTSNFRPFGLRN